MYRSGDSRPIPTVPESGDAGCEYIEAATPIPAPPGEGLSLTYDLSDLPLLLSGVRDSFCPTHWYVEHPDQRQSAMTASAARLGTA